MAKQAEEVAPRRSSRQREKRKISDEALAAEEAKPKQAKKAATKKQPKKEKNIVAEAEPPKEKEVEPKTATAKVEQAGMFRIVTWNVAGLYACIKKDFCKAVKTLDCDILCLQETKLSLKKPPPAEIAEQLKEWKYRNYANSEGKAGYSGTAILSKSKPISVQRGIGKTKHDDFGRSCTAEFEKFFLVTSYVPNSGRGLVNLDYRTNEWESDLRNYLTKLNKDKPVIYCGDLNVAHTAIDLKNDKSNYNKSAGYTQAEIDELEKLLELGYVDAYRKLYPAEEDCYTFWSYMGGARSKNVGWRLDYFLMKDCEEWIEDVVVHSKVQGSDHCPVEIKLNLP